MTDQTMSAVPANGAADEAAMKDWAELLVERARLGALAVFAVGALLAASLSSSAAASSVGVVDLGDIADADGAQLTGRRLDGTVGASAIWLFSLSEAKTVGLGLRRLDADADLVLADADGAVLHASRNEGTAKEWLSATLLAGDYVIRAEAVAPGANRFKLRYGVTEADPVVVTQLEAAAQSAAAAPSGGPMEFAGPDLEAEQTEAQQSDPDKDSGGAVARGHSSRHVADSDIVLDFGTVNLTGAASDYAVSGLHMDNTHVYLLLGAPSNRRGIYKFKQSDGSYVNHISLSYDPRGIAGSSNKLYVGRNSDGNYNRYTKSLVLDEDSRYIQTSYITGTGDLLDVHTIGDIFTSGSSEYLLFTVTQRVRTDLGDGLVLVEYMPAVRNQKATSGHTDGAIDVLPADMSRLGFTTSISDIEGIDIDGIDLATDGSTSLYVENGNGTGAVAFDVVDGDEQRNALLDMGFGSGTYDGLFFDGDMLWTLDVDSFDVAADQFTLRAFEAGAPTVPAVDEVTNASFDGGLVRSERTRGGEVPFPNHGNDIDGDGTVDFTMFAREGFTPQGLWGDSDHLYVADQHTAGVYAVSLGDLIDNDTGGGSIAYGRSFGPGMAAQDRLNHRHREGPGDSYISLSALWGDADHMWVSDDNNPWLRAYDRSSGERDDSEDILLYTNGHGLMALGIWSDGDTMWVNALPYFWYGGRSTMSYGIYTVDLADGTIAKAAGFDGLHDDQGNRARGIWSDGETMWAATPNGLIQAYDLDTGARRSRFDITTTDRPRNGQPLHPGGLWSNGEHMFYGDEYSGRIYIYQLTS